MKVLYRCSTCGCQREIDIAPGTRSIPVARRCRARFPFRGNAKCNGTAVATRMR